MKTFFHAAAFCAAFLVLTACPHIEPDPPTPEPKPDVTVSLGETSLITGETMVPAAVRKLMAQQADGSYEFVCKDNAFSLSFSFMKDYDAGHPFDRYVDHPIDYNFNLGKKPSAPAEAQDVIDLTKIMPAVVNLGSRSKSQNIYLSGLPEELIALEAITLTESSRFEVIFSLESPFFTDGTVVPEFSVDMRRFFNAVEAENGILHFDAPLTRANGYKASMVFHLNGVPMKSSNFNPSQHNLKLEAAVGLSGKVTYKDIKTTKARLDAAPSDILLNVAVVLRDVKIESVTGRVTNFNKSASKTQKFNSGLSSMALDVTDAKVQLDVANSILPPVPVLLNVASRKGGKSIGSVNGIELPLEAVEAGKTAKTSLLLTEDYDLSGLLTQMPDDFVFKASVTEPQGQNYVIPFGKQGSVSMTPTVTIPFKPASDFVYEAVDSIAVPSNVGAGLKEKAVELHGEMVNTLPLDVEMTVKLVDDSGAAHTEEVTQSFPAGSTTQINQTIKATSNPESITKVVVIRRAKGTAQSRLINVADKLQATLNIKIPGDR